MKLKLKVCSLQWYQKLILPKMLFVPCFVGIHHNLAQIAVDLKVEDDTFPWQIIITYYRQIPNSLTNKTSHHPTREKWLKNPAPPMPLNLWSIIALMYHSFVSPFFNCQSKSPGGYSPWKGVRGRAALKTPFSRSLSSFLRPPFHHVSVLYDPLFNKNYKCYKICRSRALIFAKFLF